MDDVTFTVLAYIALKRLEENPAINCFAFSKTEFIKAYKELLRRRLVGFRKFETLARKLRKLAEEGRIIRYVDREKGVYEVCVSSLEADRRWGQARERLAKAGRMRWLPLELPEEVAVRLVELAERKGKSISDIVREALEAYLLEVAEVKQRG